MDGNGYVGWCDNLLHPLLLQLLRLISATCNLIEGRNVKGQGCVVLVSNELLTVLLMLLERFFLCVW